MLELYGGGKSRWVKCYWILKELNQEFKEYNFNILKGEHKTPQLLATSPFAKVPVLKDGDFVLFESNAILTYLGEKFPETGLVPKAGSLQRAQYDQWLFYSITELEQPLWRIAKHLFVYPENLRLPQDIELAGIEFKSTMKTFDQILGQKNYLIYSRFTAADIAMAYTLKWADMLALLNEFPNCIRYLNNLLARPAFPKHLY